jgi:hypothetical protein
MSLSVGMMKFPIYGKTCSKPPTSHDSPLSNLWPEYESPKQHAPNRWMTIQKKNPVSSNMASGFSPQRNGGCPHQHRNQTIGTLGI